jgi:arsenate reductase
VTITMFGIKNCDTIKKARDWMAANGVAYDFHDYKTAGADADNLRAWIAAAGGETVLNRAGTTFRKLPDDAKIGLDADGAVALMLAQPSMIKRPVVAYPGGVLIGFTPERYAAALL